MKLHFSIPILAILIFQIATSHVAIGSESVTFLEAEILSSEDYININFYSEKGEKKYFRINRNDQSIVFKTRHAKGVFFWHDITAIEFEFVDDSTGHFGIAYKGRNDPPASRKLFYFGIIAFSVWEQIAKKFQNESLHFKTYELGEGIVKPNTILKKLPL